jgi:Ca2+-binding RTX toxin-like protein
MINSSQNAIDAILELLQNNDEIVPVEGQRFRGTKEDDVFIGDGQNNNANGRKGNDVLLSTAGDSALNGGNGNDLLMGGEGNDSLNGGTNRDTVIGGLGDDGLNGGGGTDLLDGGAGLDLLDGGNGDDQLVGGDGVDSLTGGVGADQFVYNGDVFANGTPALVAAPNINVLNTPDIITDYTIGEDQFVFDQADLGLGELVFQKGSAAGITGNGNTIVLTDGFAAAGAAARAIANNDNITAKEGVFAYFNTTLGLTRVVYSKDLGNGGDISVLANLDNQRGDAGRANIANFTAADFATV